jgi:hypothetical protein
MSDEHVDAIADRFSRDEVTFASLPLPLARRIFLALPVDARGRASCVCRAWCDALADPSLWTRLDMSGVFRADWPRFEAVLRGAAGRSRGQLCLLDLSQQDITWNALRSLLCANADSLRELHLHSVEKNVWFSTVDAVVAAAPLLQVLTAECVLCAWEVAPRLLRTAEPPFALQMRSCLSVRFDNENDNRAGGMERVEPFAAALADATLQPALSRVSFRKADAAQPAVMGALVDAALARRLRELTLDFCTPPAAAPLARLLAEGSLVVFDIQYVTEPFARTPLFDAAGAALVADALRVNTTLTRLDLHCVDLCGDMRAAGAVLGALVGHQSMRKFTITRERGTAAFGDALAALIAVDAPALHTLVCSCNSLGDAGLAPIVEALALNRHLRELDVRDATYGNRMSEAFARERLLPALRANTTLCDFRRCCSTRGQLSEEEENDSIDNTTA